MGTISDTDFVITWVDGGDPAWRKQKNEYERIEKGSAEDLSAIDSRDERYRDYGLLRYWFRAVEKYAPWVRKIHFVTWGHLPEWLDTSCPKLQIDCHEDFIPKEFLPTFNCNPIELNLHRIKDLSENFVYFNDDIYLTSPVDESYFFRDGLPRDMLAFQPVVANPANPVMSHLFLNNTLILAKYFDKRGNVRTQPGKYFKIGYPPMYFFYNLLELAFPKFTGFYTVHGPVPFCKKSFSELWEKEEAALRETSMHRFRSKDDLTDYLVRDWQKLSGNFSPANLQKDFSYFELSDDNSALCDALRKRRKKIICINDANEKLDFERTKAELTAVFEEILPEKSSFEKSAGENK